MLNDKIYTNGITIIQFAWDVEVIVGQLRKDLHLYQNPILCAPSIEALNILKNNLRLISLPIIQLLLPQV